MTGSEEKSPNPYIFCLRNCSPFNHFQGGPRELVFLFAERLNDGTNVPSCTLTSLTLGYRFTYRWRGLTTLAMVGHLCVVTSISQME